ncbi:MAG TPA: FHA domain-containing protein [Candidatus Lustribacter sp.]|nr:FHA domain-containing protein [Candidatus Lustribacter sp.]
MPDPRYATLAVSAGLMLYVLFVRDRRGAPPPAALDATIPAGIELVVNDGATISTRRLARRILVGRAPSADVRIDDPRVSRLHARIEMRDDGVYVEDLGSRNGTFVDGAPVVSGRRLANGDEITLGTASIIFRGVGSWK